MKKILMVAVLAAMGAGAAPIVEITSVQQQYPWTNTVDITYTSTGIESNNTYYVVFKAYDAASKEIGVITNELKISQGSTWVAQWEPPFNVRYENCTMTPYVYKGGQDDYMVVDLETWQVTYEGMSIQEASNKKYDTDEYKTKKLVLRKVPAGTYKIGAERTITTSAATDFYIGIFQFTEAQYDRIAGVANPSGSKKPKAVSWNTMRGSAGVAAVPSTGICATLNSKNSLGLRGFDIPTLAMWEIAARGSDTHKYIGSDTFNNATYEQYGWFSTNSSNIIHEVGLKLPNTWGIYDMHGNTWEQIRCAFGATRNSTTQADALKPLTQGTDANQTWIMGGSKQHTASGFCYPNHYGACGSGKTNVGDVWGTHRITYFPQ